MFGKDEGLIQVKAIMLARLPNQVMVQPSPLPPRRHRHVMAHGRE